MSAASTVSKAGVEPTEVASEAVLDVLYEVLAEGTEPGADLTVEEVEAFLHSHAREPKSQQQLVAFALEHDLPLEAGRYGTDAALADLASGLHEAHQTGAAPVMLQAADNHTAPEASRDPRPAVEPPAAPAATLEQPAKVATSWLWLALAGTVVLVAGLSFMSFQHNRVLDGELSTLRLQRQTTDLGVTAVERRAERLEAQLGASQAMVQKLTAQVQELQAAEELRRAVEQARRPRRAGRFKAPQTPAVESAQ